MPDKTYCIAPCSDTVIILRNPLKNLAPWEQPEDKTDDTIKPPTAVPASFGPDDSDLRTPESLSGGDGTAVRDQPYASQPENKAATRSSSTEDSHTKTKKVPAGGIHYHCSGAHLILATKTFEKALTGNWAESVRHSDGRYYIIVEDWDEIALLTRLNVIHLRNDKVPRDLDLEELAKIASLVDYYQCYEATAFCTEKWTRGLVASYQIPNSYGRNLMLWLFIAWVFKLSPVFEESTVVAIDTGTDGSLRTLGLPIPQSVSVRIDEKRSTLISALIGDLYALLDTYRATSYICPVHKDHSSLCGTVMLGALTKALDKLNLAPRPKEPFDGMSLKDLIVNIRGIQEVRWRTFDTPKPDLRPFSPMGARSRGTSLPDLPHACNLRVQVLEALKPHGLLKGLEFEECGQSESEPKRKDTSSWL